MQNSDFAHAFPSIDFALWPAVHHENDQDRLWWEKMGDSARQEFVDAMDDIQFAKINEDGSLTTNSRTFRFWTKEPNADKALTRIDWVSPSDESFAVACDYDETLHKLSATSPLQAGLEIARRFVSAITQTHQDYLAVAPLATAIAIQNHLEYTDTWIGVDPWSGHYTVYDSEGLNIATPFPATRQFALLDFPPDGPRVTHSLIIQKAEAPNAITENTFDDMSPHMIREFSREVDLVLENFGLTPIESSAWDDVLSDQAGTKFADEMTDQSVDTILYWPMHMDEAHHSQHDIKHGAIARGIMEVSAVSHIQNDVLITPFGEAPVYPAEGEFGLFSFTLPDASDDIEIARTIVGSNMDTPESMIAFFRDLPTKIPGLGLPLGVAETENRKAAIIARAITEIALSFHAALPSSDPIRIPAAVITSETGHLRIVIGRRRIDTTISIEPMILHVDNTLTQPYARFYIMAEDAVPPMVAKRLESSSFNVLSGFGIPIDLIKEAIADAIEVQPYDQSTYQSESAFASALLDISSAIQTALDPIMEVLGGSQSDWPDSQGTTSDGTYLNSASRFLNR